MHFVGHCDSRVVKGEALPVWTLQACPEFVTSLPTIIGRGLQVLTREAPRTASFGLQNAFQRISNGVLCCPFTLPVPGAGHPDLTAARATGLRAAPRGVGANLGQVPYLLFVAYYCVVIGRRVILYRRLRCGASRPLCFLASAPPGERGRSTVPRQLRPEGRCLLVAGGKSR